MLIAKSLVLEEFPTPARVKEALRRRLEDRCPPRPCLDGTIAKQVIVCNKEAVRYIKT
jgi:hypothetical protein